jgi:nucleoside-diphosphate-sugar epimerase
VLAETAVASGWDVTCFNRGRTGRDVAGTEAVRGDRAVEADVERLASHGRWDAVVDTGAHEPADTAMMAAALTRSVERYVLVSTVSAYRHWPAEPITEESMLWPARPDTRAGDGDLAGLPRRFAYGTLKAGCEAAVRARFAYRAVILRPGVLLGPYEYVGRLDAMLGRAARGGPMLVAGSPDRPIQPVDVRDLAHFVLDVVGHRRSGAFNIVAPRRGHATYGHLIDACLRATGSSAEPVWVDPRPGSPATASQSGRSCRCGAQRPAPGRSTAHEPSGPAWRAGRWRKR